MAKSKGKSGASPKPVASGAVMKLAEALLLRGDMQKKQASLRSRIENNAAVQEGDKPHEDPAKLMAEFNGLTDDLANLVYRINIANLDAKLSDGRPLTRALADRDALKQRHAMLLAAAEGANKQPDRYGMSEIKWVAAVNVASLQRQADDLSKQLRELNGKIQETNWRVEVGG